MKRHAGKGKDARKTIRIVLGVLIVCLAVGLAYELGRPYRRENAIDTFMDNALNRGWDEDETYDELFSQITYTEAAADGDLTGLLYTTPERGAYEDGAMTIVLPALELNRAVSNGTTRADLRKGPSLFDYSNLPGEGDRNVSIAGHRERGCFYYLDRVGEGDNVYLIYDGMVFQYAYLDRTVVMPTDWSVITNQGFPCVTLITCTPIGVANRRMVVRFELADVRPYTEGYSFR